MSNSSLYKLIGAVVLVFILLIGSLMFTERVPEGKVAVVYSPSGGATEVLNPGWHLIGLFEKTQEYPTRITIVKTDVSVTTQDGKKITMPARYEMKVDKSKVLDIFRELGSQNIEDIQEGYLYQKLFKASRETISQYSVLDIFGTKTTEASAKVTENMRKSSEGLGFIITDVTLGNPEVDAETQKAIDQRVKAAQTLEQLKLDKQIAEETAEKQIIEAKGLADAQVEKARGQADAELVRADAQAKANKMLNASLTENVLKRMELEARLKHGWVTIQGATPLVETKEEGK